jgi:hypothetical protein
MLLSFVLILALDRPLPDLATAGALAAYFAGGRLWASLLTLVIWRVHPFLPARSAVAEVYRTLVILTSDLYAALTAANADVARWEAHASDDRRAVREAIEAARSVVFDTCAHVAQPAHGSSLDRRAASRLLRRLRPLLQVLGRAILTEDADLDPQIGCSIYAMAAEIAELPANDPLRPIGNAHH